MAEAALAATAVQLIDVGVRTLLLLSRLMSEVKNAPDKIRALQHDVKSLLSVARAIQSDPSTVGLDSSPLANALEQALQLEALLNDLAIGPKDEFRQRFWKAWRSAKNEQKLDNLCKRLEYTKTTLLVWFEKNGASVLQAVNRRTEATDAGVQGLVLQAQKCGVRANEAQEDVRETIAVARSTDVKSSGIMNSLQQSVVPVVEAIDKRSIEINFDVRQGLSIGQGISVRTRAIEDRMQTQLMPSIEEFNRKLDVEVSRPLVDLKASIEKMSILCHNAASRQDILHSQQSTDLALDRQSTSKSSKPHIACGVIAAEELPLTIQNDGVSRPKRSDTQQHSTYTPRRPCSCFPHSWFTPVVGRGKFAINYYGRREHSKDCYLYRISLVRRSVGVRGVLYIRWLWQKINYTLTVSNGAGGFSITPSLSTTHVVDRYRSPAFRMMTEIYSDLVDYGSRGKSLEIFHGLHLIVSRVGTLKQRLIESFRYGAASPYDVDSHGNNLLHDAFSILYPAVDLLLKLSAKQKVIDEMMDHTMEVLSFLAGFELNETGQNDDFRTPLGRFVSDLNLLGASECSILENNFHQLIKCKDLAVSQSPREQIFGWRTSVSLNYIYRQFPGTVECERHSPLIIAVIQENEAETTRLICTGVDVNEASWDRTSTLSAALKWPKGVKILLEAGARMINGPPSYWDHAESESVMMILESDQGSYTSELHRDYLLVAFGVDRRLCERLAGTLAKRRRALAAMARSYLPPADLKALGIGISAEDHGNLDEHAVATADALAKYGYAVPEILQPIGRGPSVYATYDPSTFSCTAANALYDAGFRDLHVPDACGFTPLQAACLAKNIEMVEWFLGHGEDLRTSPLSLSCSCFHLLAANLGFFFDDTSNFEKLINAPSHFWSSLLLHIDVSSPDACRCACSVHGCTATSMLLRNSDSTWYQKLGRLRRWCNALALSVLEVEACCEEFMRLETFERLGMTHVCCRPSEVAEGLTQMSEEDQIEIMEEESSFSDELQTLMERYHIERAKFKGPAFAFLGRWSAWLREDGLNEPSEFERFRTDYPSLCDDYYTKVKQEDMLDVFREGRFTIPDF